MCGIAVMRIRKDAKIQINSILIETINNMITGPKYVDFTNQ
jgi:hypothetical protein